MIITQMYRGQGLGNQLWCYVVTRVIAKDKGYNFGIMNPEIFKGINFMNLDFGSPVVGGSGPEGGPPEILPKGISHYYKERVIRHPVTGEDISMRDDDLVNIPDKTKIDGTMQDERYIEHRKSEIRSWLKVRPEYECRDYSDDDICVINFRGGEYTRVPRLFLPQSYWDQAVAQMRKINPKFKFVVITDDVPAAKQFFPEFEVFHFDIAKDYVIIKNAKYLIISNSSFAWFPAWLSDDLKFCIAPKYWWAHNQSDGYWSCTFNITKGWMYLDRSGKLQDYQTCLKELTGYIASHREFFYPKKIKSNFLVVSNHNNDLGWIARRTNNYLIYDRSEHPFYPYTIDTKKIIRSPNIGYNLYDYFTFIIDHYNRLPDRTIFTKGNVFPRHLTEVYFDQVSNNNFFTPLEDRTMLDPKMPSARYDADGGYSEINNSWFLKEYPPRYFSDYNDFLKFCYKDPILPKYVRFAPGASYIVPKANVSKLPKVFYQNLLKFISYATLPGEAHIIERALYTLWTSNFEINDQMLHPINPKTIPVLVPRPRSKLDVIRSKRDRLDKQQMKSLLKKLLPKPLKGVGKRTLILAKVSARKVLSLGDQDTSSSKNRYFSLSESNLSEITEYRKNIKIYDCFYFFSELDLLEIRLNILDPYVDYFVIVEATETFTGIPKKLVYEQHKNRFRKFAHKIIYHVTTDTPVDADDLRLRLYNKNISALDKQIFSDALTSDNVPKGESHWLKEFYQKESLKRALEGLSDNDFVFVSDVDEIWNPLVPIDFSRDDLYKYQQDAYYYFLNNRSNDDWETGWTGTVATKYRNIKNACLNHLRTHRKNTYTVLKNGGWHFTFQGGTKQMKKKLKSYGHKEFNVPEITSRLEEVVAKNQDYRGRNLKFWVDESNLPQYLIDNRYKYRQLFK